MKKVYKTLIVFILTLSLLAVPFSFPPGAEAASVPPIKMKWKLTSQTSVRISWSGSKKLKYWRIRRAKIDKKGNVSKYKTVKIQPRSKKTFTVRKLKKNRGYIFEITGGVKKNGKYKPTSTYEYIWPLYTGISEVAWDDYAFSDAPYSPSSIELWGVGSKDGYPIRGYQIFRKKSGETEYRKIATIKTKKLYFTYKDTKVTKGATYKYKFRAYGPIKKKRRYSPFSDVMTKSATNQNGRFTSELVSASPEELVVRLTSAKYNSFLVIGYSSLNLSGDYNLDMNAPDEESLDPVGIITAYSSNNTNWTSVSAGGSVTANPGSDIYLKIRAANNNTDLSKATGLTSEDVTYNQLPCYFYVQFGGDGGTTINSEMVH